jgi:hypothetical protein
MNCEIENIVKGQDCDLTLNLKDKTGAVINATLFTKLVIIVRHANGTIIAKYSMNPALTYYTIDMSGALTGVLVIKLLTMHTMASAEGKLYYEVHGQIPDALSVDDSVLDLISTNNYLCNIINSITGGAILP